MKYTKILAPFLFTLFCQSIGFAATWNVATTGNDSSGKGSISAPFATFQKAIDASSNGDTIFVSSGTYSGSGNRDINLRGKQIMITSISGPESTILDLGRQKGFTATGSETSATTIQGFTITNGYVTSSQDWTGNGIIDILGNAGMTVANCIFKNNEVRVTYITTNAQIIAKFGGGDKVTIKNCLFYNNILYGGAWDGWSFSRILTLEGPTTEVEGCTIYGNQLTSYNSAGGQPIHIGFGSVKNTIVWGNTVATNGKGIVAGSVSYCLFDTQVWNNSNSLILSGFLNSNPLFKNTSGGDFRLALGSPAIDAGDPNSPIDLNGSRADIGFRYAALGDMVTVQGGTLPQSSGMAGQAVSTFQIGKYEVTWGEWKAVRDWAVSHGYTDLTGVGNTVPTGSADNFPVSYVNWYDVVKWCNARSEKEGLTPVYQASGATYKTGQSEPIVNSGANGYRLPTEAEWEWAARGGVSSQGFTYSGSNDLNQVAWYMANSNASMHSVGTKTANELGIFDMTGNVSEICGQITFFPISPGTPYIPFRGGNPFDNEYSCPVATRNFISPVVRDHRYGFRLARNAISSISGPQLTLEQAAGTAIQNSQTVSFGNVIVGTNKTLTFTLKNTGSAQLTGLYINNYGWDIQASPLPSDTLSPGESMNFTATYTPYWGGQSSTTFEIYSNDPGTNPFTINLTGNGLAWWQDSDGDGMSDAQEYSLSNLGFDWQTPQPELVSAYNVRIETAAPSTINMSGKPLTQDLGVSGGTGFVWQVDSGTLPPGVMLNSSGQIFGTPTTPGNYKFTVKVTNAEGFSASKAMQIRVIPPATFGGGYNFANFAGRLFGFLGSGDSSGTFTGSGADSGGFTGSADGRSSFTGSADFAGLKPALRAPSGVTVDASGNIYVSDSANNQVRKITATGQIQNLAGVFTGSGGQDGTKWNARFANPQGMDCDAAGNIYVADQDNHAIRKITATGTVTMVAGSFTGSGAAGFSGSADGGAKTTARFNKPSDVAVDAAGNIYVADSGNHAIRKISTNGTVTTLAGTMGAAGNTNANGSNARFRSPQGIAVDGNGTVYVADTGNQIIRRITANGAVSTFAGAAFTGSASPLGGRASFTGSAHGAFTGSADATTLPASVDGSATTARFSYPTDITIDSTGNLYVTDSGTEKIRKITTNGAVTTIGGSPDGFFYNPLAVAAGANGTLYVADAGNNRIARGLPGSAPLQLPTITVQPVSVLGAYAGTTVNFSVSASGGNLAYQWYRNGTAINGATSPSLARTASTPSIGSYSVAVTNTLGTEWSDDAVLDLRPPPQVSGGPSEPARPGDSVQFAADYDGPTPTAYQWLKNGKPIPGRTGPTLNIDSVSFGDSGIYSLAMTTASGKIITDGQALFVEDTGRLVYRVRATGTSAENAVRTTARLEGYLVRDRDIGQTCFVWTNPSAKTWTIEWMPDLTMKSTGPMIGSTTVLRRYTEYDPEEESIWFSGIDKIVRVGTNTQVLAPTPLDGYLNTITTEGSTIIEMLKTSLTLDTIQTQKSITIDNNIQETVERITGELQTKGYQESE